MTDRLAEVQRINEHLSVLAVEFPKDSFVSINMHGTGTRTLAAHNPSDELLQSLICACAGELARRQQERANAEEVQA